MPEADSGWQDFLEAQKGWRTAYFGYQPQFGRSPNEKKYFQNQFADVQDRFMGQQARQIMGGGIPDLTFGGFLSDYFKPQGGAAQEWGAMSPQQRGVDFTRFSPRTRRVF